MQEEWKDAVNIDGYQVSNYGRIRSKTRAVRCKNGVRTHVGKVLVAFRVKSTGYCQVMIGRKKFSVHRLVARAWCCGYFDGACVDHKNGVRDDNRAANLEWVTMSENNRRSFSLGRKPPFLGKFSSDHCASKPVTSVCLKTGRETHWASGMDAVRAGFDSSCISRCCAGKIKTHKGHIWRMDRRAEQGVDIWGAE